MYSWGEPIRMFLAGSTGCTGAKGTASMIVRSVQQAVDTLSRGWDRVVLQGKGQRLLMPEQI